MQYNKLVVHILTIVRGINDMSFPLLKLETL
jgi:hypothetical protein